MSSERGGRGPGLVSSLAGLERVAGKCVLLYSGGLDSSYFMWWAAQRGIDLVALSVRLGAPDDPDADGLAALPDELGHPLRVVDATEAFVEEHVRPAIRANCLYQGIFPVSSTLSRPLMARIAVDLAREVGADCVVHTAEFHQNSCARFNNSIRALAPELVVGNPLLEERISRPEKLRALAGAVGERGIHSVDANIWARVIENGELDSVANRVPEHVFAWTRGPGRSTREPEELVLGFTGGVPTSLDGRALPLRDLLTELNARAGGFGIGRFNGVEDTRYGHKNHEVREAPAAAVVLAAHRHLEQVVLTGTELRVKAALDHEWTDLVVAGGWYSTLRAALDRFQERISLPVHGEVGVVLAPGSAYVSWVDSPAALGGVADGVDDLSGGLSFARAFDLGTAELTSRQHLGEFGGPRVLEDDGRNRATQGGSAVGGAAQGGAARVSSGTEQQR
ncbi:argininosuccinate synthase domain-containing protein [Actinokineospora spheciospongiae]|uniref:argininosuccinate synthase domain-containing protein n=1 Tax=Actinokineospora spheciospongiae TaxID=909613 RepID=UPI000D90F71A|nr:argininosuccinate synthase domain-containing protein [Actinokineospora spheciospongiae]PWW60405.1 argininosuccinate synthase [Actinokineospora spheciospongiae]